MESPNSRYDSATLVATRVKYKGILREQFTGLIIFSFSFTLSTFIPNIEARIFLDTHIKMCVHEICIIVFRTFFKNI